MSARWVRHRGLEIGALHRPLWLPPGARVEYVDYKTRAENVDRYPELAGQTIVETDLVDDGFSLSRVADGSVDFLIASHALEHSPDPLSTLQIWRNKLRPQGVLFLAVPIAERCYDNGRPITSLAHLREDQQLFQRGDVAAILARTRDHLLEFLRISDANIRKMNHMPAVPDEQLVESADRLMDGLAQATAALDPESLGSTTPSASATASQAYGALMSAHIHALNFKYDLHYHTFSPTSYRDLLIGFGRDHGMRLVELRKSGSGECIGVLKAA
jgi:hypothetical protein